MIYSYEKFKKKIIMRNKPWTDSELLSYWHNIV